MTARTLVLKSISRILAASVPVHAPVPGSGMPTKSSRASGSPRPAFAFSFSPPFSPFSRHQVKNFPIYFFITSPDKNLSSEQENNRNRKHISDDGDQIGRKRRNMESYRVRNRTTQLDERNHGNQKYNQIFGNHIHLSFFTKCYRFLVQRSYCSVMPAICPV